MIVRFLDEVIRLGYTGEGDVIVAARDAGRRYLRDRLPPAWWVNDTWGRYFWDWEDPVLSCLITSEVARYIMDHKAEFPNWGYDARNILTLFFNHTSVSPASNGDVCSGAWAYPESSGCCGRSLWYNPMIHAPAFAQYAVETGDAWMRERAYRQMMLQTYDIHETGVSEDNIDGGTVVNGAWFNIAHPLPLRFVLAGIGWMPEEMGASRENHIVRSTAVVNSVTYGDGQVEYTTFDAPENTAEVLYYKNGLAQGRHTLRIVPGGDRNPYSKGNRVAVEAVQFSSANGAHGFPTGTGPVETQRMIFGYTNGNDYRDSQGHSWRPATEFVTAQVPARTRW